MVNMKTSLYVFKAFAIFVFLPMVSSFQASSPSLLPRSSVHQFQPKLQSVRKKESMKLQSTFLTTAAAAVDTFWKNSPYAAAALVCGVKACVADFVAQRRHFNKRVENGEVLMDIFMNEEGLLSVKKPKKISLQRNVAYVLYGSVYQGLAQEFIFNHIYPILFGVGTDVVTVLSKVMFNLLFQTTLVTLPIAYMSKAMVFRYSFKEAFRRYVHDIKNHKLLVKFYLLWFPVNSMAFSIIPEHFRVTFIAMASFFWLIILSSIANETPINKDQESSIVDGKTVSIGVDG